MWRDLWAYGQALRRHLVGLATGAVVSVVLLIWEEVLKKGDIPTWVWGLAALYGFFVSGFYAWREEHSKVAPREIDPEEFRRPQFETEVAKLNPQQEAVLRYVVRVGDADAVQIRDNFFRDQGKSVSAQEADLLLTAIAETGLLEVKAKVSNYARYRFKPVWEKLLVEWAAPPTVVDKRIADKAKVLRRTLGASFEDWPAGLKTLDDLTTWAGNLMQGYQVTEKALTEIVELRPDASRRVERVVGEARDEYYAAADVINGLFGDDGLSIQWDERPAVEAQLRDAERHVRQCVAALDTLTRDWS